MLEAKKVDIDKLKSEKRKVQQEYDDQIEIMRKDMEKKLEREKREMNEQFMREMDDIERDEKTKYERKLTQMKKELALSSAAPDMERELNEYRQQQEMEYEQQVREFKREQEKMLQEEEQRLERSRQTELDEYEEILNKQFEAELRRKQQSISQVEEQEEKELQIQKLRIDQQYQDKVEQFRREMQLKYEAEKRAFEEEKQKKLYEIQGSIENLNLASSDKQKLKTEIDDLIKEQRELQYKIDGLRKEQDEAENKNRQLQREINELNIQLTANRATGTSLGAVENDPRVQQLRDEIAKKNLQLSQAQREYKTLLENPTAVSEVKAVYASSNARAGQESGQISKLESELSEIKALLANQHEMGTNAAAASHYNRQMWEGEVDADQVIDEMLAGKYTDEEVKKFVARQKTEIKKVQEKLD